MKQFQNGRLTDRELVMGKLAREIGRGHDPIYHGTRAPLEVLRSGKLKPDGSGKVSFSRSPEVAAHFALLLGDGFVRWSPAVLVLCRSSLIQSYRLDPWRYGEDWHDEQEEVIWDRTVSFRRHLLGVVTGADVTNVLGPSKQSELLGLSHRESWTYHREELKAGSKLVRRSRARVRNVIDTERKQRGAANARLPAVPPTNEPAGTAVGFSGPSRPAVPTAEMGTVPR